MVAAPAETARAQTPLVEGERPAPRPQFNPVRWIIKSILHFIVKSTILIFRGIKRYPLPALIVLIVVIGSLFFLSSLAASLTGGGSVTSAQGRPLAIETYLTGQKDFNAALMWEAMGDEIKSSAQAGNVQTAFKQRADKEKADGVRYTNHRYVGGTALDDGRSVHLYIVSLIHPASGSTQEQQLPFTFTLNRSGKIINLD
jgi:hypothetical protein